MLALLVASAPGLARPAEAEDPIDPPVDPQAEAPGPAWSARVATTADDWVNGVAVGADGSTVVAGYTFGALPGKTAYGYATAIVLGYAPDGTLRWADQFGSVEFPWANIEVAAADVAIDADGNAYAVGWTNGALPGFTNPGARDMTRDGFIRSYEPDGTVRWTKEFGGAASETALQVLLDPQGNVVVTGIGDATFQRVFSPEGEELSSSSPGTAWRIAFAPDGGYARLGDVARGGWYDGLVTRYDADGTQLWQVQIGTPEPDSVSSLVFDAHGNLYVAGATQGTLPEQVKSGDAYHFDAFVMSFDPEGSQRWLHQFGGPADELTYGLAVDGTGSLVMAGMAGGALPGQAHVGSWDAFLAAYDLDGNAQWVRQYGSSDADFVSDLVIGPTGDPVVAGHSYGTRYEYPDPVDEPADPAPEPGITALPASDGPATDGSVFELTAVETAASATGQDGVMVDFGPDTIAPTKPGTPVVTLRTGAQLAGTGIPATVSWPAASDSGSGVGAYALERSTDAGATWQQVTTSASASASVTLKSGVSTRFRVTATDRAGNASAASISVTRRARILQQSSTSLRWSSGWTTVKSSSYSGGSARYAKARGSWSTVRFTGREIAFVSTRASSRGKANLYLGSTSLGSVDLRRSTTQYRALAWKKTWSSNATRTFKVVVAGTSGRPRVDVDAFVILD